MNVGIILIIASFSFVGLIVLYKIATQHTQYDKRPRWNFTKKKWKNFFSWGDTRIKNGKTLYLRKGVMKRRAKKQNKIKDERFIDFSTKKKKKKKKKGRK